ncbi:MAG: NAD-binding protein [Chroococcidiopsidaceae cyanobacterium CP_BM_RX_35]|nr:NAD-binding protein [Chroococcidiopsidaceae cyanobacterium CP_BM_RX_35]
MQQSADSTQPSTENSQAIPDQKPASELIASLCLVCGLGSLGQYCVAALKEFGVSVSAIEIAHPSSWEVKNLPSLLEDLLIGDCRQLEILQQAKIHQCRAVLLVTSDERVNIEAAFAVRLLNPRARLIVRSAKQNLNELLGQQLGNFVAFEATQLPAPAFAIAALHNETQGFINLGEHLLRVVESPMSPAHRWCNCRLVHELNTRTRRVLSHIPAATPLPTQFYQWEPDARIRAGDMVAYIEVTQRLTGFSQSPVANPVSTKTKHNFSDLRQKISNLTWSHLQTKLIQFWQSTAQQQTKRVAIICGITVVALLLGGTILLKVSYPQASWLGTFYTTAVMLLGAYNEVFASLNPGDTSPVWLRLLNVGLILAGTAFVGVLYALLTESLLAVKFQLPTRRPPIPQQDHVVLIGLGRVGRQVATFLQQLKQPLVGVSHVGLESSVLPQMPLIVGDLTHALTKVNLATAKSVVIATDDEMANLEIGLMAHAANPHSALMIRTFDPLFSQHLAQLLPYAKVLCANSLAAEAFAAAAFGENVLNLLRLNEQTLLVTEYNLEPEDSLSGLLLAEVAYGYGVIPILYQKHTQELAKLMPSDDTRLEPGDRLIVLATTESLQQIQRGVRRPCLWQVQVDKALSKDAVFEGASTIARTSGCSISVATELMHHLPGVLHLPLYKHQAQRLVRELKKHQVLAHLIPSHREV